MTTTNTAPVVSPGIIAGFEDALSITGSLIGHDDNPGDSIFFENTSLPLHGSLNLDISGLIEYVPDSGFCGNDSFLFRAYDQW